jgi:hypothetical protein
MLLSNKRYGSEGFLFEHKDHLILIILPKDVYQILIYHFEFSFDKFKLLQILIY